MTISRVGPLRSPDTGPELTEKVVHIRRVAKVVKGGRHLRFNALVVVGDGQGGVGAGMGKGVAVPDAVRKGTTIARKRMVLVPMRGSTIPHQVSAKFGASTVLIKPASPGAGVIAGGGARAVMEAAGIKDVVAKTMGSRNPINVVHAALAGLQMIQGEQGRERPTDLPAVQPVYDADEGAQTSVAEEAVLNGNSVAGESEEAAEIPVAASTRVHLPLEQEARHSVAEPELQQPRAEETSIEGRAEDAGGKPAEASDG